MLVEELEAAWAGVGPVVGAHPIAGSEASGAGAARADLFRGRRCILTPTPATDRAAARARFGIGTEETCVLVFGGSLGARSINHAAVEAFADAEFRVLHAAGERDPRTLAGLARTRMKARHDDLVEALDGMFDDHHGELAGLLLDQIAFLDHRIEVLGARAAELTAAMPAAWGVEPDGATGPHAGATAGAPVLNAVARAGYRAAFTTRPSALLAAGAALQLPRLRYDINEAPAGVVRRIKAAGG